MKNFAWHCRAPFNYDIALWGPEKIVCVFRFGTRIEADRFMARNGIRL